MINFFAGEYEFLSNFYFSPIEYEGIRYETVEHAFQAAKTLDTTERYRIAAAKTPGQAKRMGRSVDLRPDWENIKIEVMDTLLRKKFKDPNLQQMLLATEGQFLIEGNVWHDNFWGECECTQCQGIEGKNHLGLLLMQIREELKTPSAQFYSLKQGLIKTIQLVPENYEDIKKSMKVYQKVEFTQDKTPHGNYHFIFTQNDKIICEYTNQNDKTKESQYAVFTKDNGISIISKDDIEKNYIKESSNVWYKS